MHSKIRYLGLATTLLCVSSLAAQTRDSASDARVLPTITAVGSLLERVGPDIRFSRGLSVQIVPADPLNVRSSRLLATFAGNASGAALYDDLGSRFKPTLTFRGFAVGPVVGLPQGVSVFLDGIPVNEVDAGQVNLELLPFDAIRQLELYSSTSALLGPNTMGGAVNLVTRQGQEEFDASLSLGGASFGGYKANGFASGTLGAWKMFAAATSDEEEGWRQRTYSRVQHGLLNVMRSGAGRSARFQFNVARSLGQTAGSLPLSVYEVKPDSNLTGGDFEDITQLHLAVAGNADTRFGGLSASAWIRASRAERFNVNQINDPDVRSFSRTRTAGARADWNSKRDVGDVTFDLRTGLGGSISNSELEIFAERIDPGLTTSVRTPITRFDVFAEGTARRDRVSLSGGLRFDRVTVPFNNLLNPARDTTSVFSALNPRVSLAVNATRNVRAWAAIVRSFRAPAVIEIACADPEEPCPLPFALGDDPPINPVTATTREAGLSFAMNAVRLNATVFRSNVRDEIFLFPYDDDSEPEGSTIDGFFANVPRTRRDGFEVALSIPLVRNARASARYNRSKATFQSGGLELFSIREEAGGENEVEEGDELPLVPAHTLTMRLESSPLARLRAAVDTRFIGERWLRGDETNEEAPLPSYWVTDLQASLRIGNWDIEGAVHNILDARFATFGTFNFNQGSGGALERFLTPGQPRAFQLSLTRRFGPGV